MYVCVVFVGRGIVHMTADVLRVQGKVLGPMELHLQAVVSCLMWNRQPKLGPLEE